VTHRTFSETARLSGFRPAIAAIAMAASFCVRSYAAPTPPRVRLVAVGDICLAGGVERGAVRSGSSYPFTRMLNDLRGADIAFGNLECALSSRGSRIPKRYNFRARPAWAARLAAAGFDVLSLANNHTQDYGRAALGDTVTHVQRAGIRAVGAGLTRAAAHAVQIVTVRGLRVGFLAYLGMFPPLLPVVSDSPSVAMGYPESVRRDVALARGKVDILLVSLHAGREMTLQPSARQKEIAHAAADAGADLVIGHHPHIVQPSERYRGARIFYSLGNFVFSPSASVLRRPDGPWSAMCVAEVGRGRKVEARLVPLLIVDRQPRHRPLIRPRLRRS